MNLPRRIAAAPSCTRVSRITAIPGGGNRQAYRVRMPSLKNRIPQPISAMKKSVQKKFDDQVFNDLEAGNDLTLFR
jgi:hypothetical protein